MKRIVVIGHGMVGARFVDDLTRHAAATGAQFDVTVLGDEPHEPYNRLMLSEVVAGRADLVSLTLPAPPDAVTVHAGCAAVRLDRQRRVVIDAEGRDHQYDVAVLAVGAEAALPSIPGLCDGKGEGIRALRTIDDCRELLAACWPGRRMCVLGGGLLGVEIACGLRARGIDVTLVHRGTHVMDRQINAASGTMAAATLADLGIEMRLANGIVRVVRDGGRLVSVELTNGEVVPLDLLVIATGVTPRTVLAKDAGISVDLGILVDEQLRVSGDGSVAAIGDCAQTSAGCLGLLQPGWEQAEYLARDLCCGGENAPAPAVNRGDPARHDVEADDPNATGTEPHERKISIVKLKAVGLDMLALGERIPEPFSAARQGLRVVSLNDAVARRSVTVTVNGEQIVSAVVIGSARVAADLTTAYERGTPVPLDPAHLLIQPTMNSATEPTSTSPSAMPSGTTVCICNGVTKKQITTANAEGAHSVEEIARVTRATTGCGGCRSTVRELLNENEPADHS